MDERSIEEEVDRDINELQWRVIALERVVCELVRAAAVQDVFLKRRLTVEIDRMADEAPKDLVSAIREDLIPHGR